MKPSPSLPPMRHSPAYHEPATSFPTAQSRRPSPAVPPLRRDPLQRPPVVYLNDSRHPFHQYMPSENCQIQSPVSSATSASSASFDSKLYHIPQPYWLGPQGERDLMAEGSLPGSQVASELEHGRLGRSYAHNEMLEANSAVLSYVQQHQDYDEEQEKDHAIWVLIWLSFLDPIHCFCTAIFSILTVLILVLISPIRLCQSQKSDGTALIRIVAPVFKHHLQMICAPSLEIAHTFDFSPTRLILVQVASPFLSLGISVASWVAAAFWLFAVIMGNPDGTERRDDGKAAVLLVRNTWEKYLLSATRND